MKKLFGTAYFLVLSLYALFSYSLTDPNLVLTSWGPYWSFQQWMWQTFFVNPQLLSITYIGLITLMFVCYYFIGRGTADVELSDNPHKSNWWWILLLILPLLFSYNALSHDIFNYMFNSKMVLFYHANPHQQIALDFPTDSWVRFMHNTNTPAPYGYGWTIISLLPSLLGLGKFTLTWLLYRLFSVLSIGFLLFSYFKLVKIDQHQKKLIWPIFFFVIINPLFLIEMVSNSHNDIWMMAPAILSFALIHGAKKLNLKVILTSILLITFSISIKLSTLVLLPVWLAIFVEVSLSRFQLPQFIRKSTSFVHLHYADLSILLLFIPLLTPRSQQFNSWYLVWLLVWLPFARWNWLKGALLVLSISSLYRYVPWLLAGGFSEQIVFQQKLVTWIPLILYLLLIGLRSLFSRSFRHSSVE